MGCPPPPCWWHGGAATAHCVALPQTVTVHPRKTTLLPYLQCSLFTTFPPDPYYKTRAFICLDTESRLTSACGLWPRLTLGVSGGLHEWVVSKASRLQGSKLNPSIIQKGTPGSAGEPDFVCLMAPIKPAKQANAFPLTLEF